MTRRSTCPTPKSPRFYGALIDPARASKPKDKPRIERPMPYIRDSFCRRPRVRLAGADAGRGAALEHRGLRGPQASAAWRAPTPAAVFEAIGADALMPLPRRAFEPVVYTVGAIGPGVPRQGPVRRCIRCRGG